MILSSIDVLFVLIKVTVNKIVNNYFYQLTDYNMQKRILI